MLRSLQPVAALWISAVSFACGATAGSTPTTAPTVVTPPSTATASPSGHVPTDHRAAAVTPGTIRCGDTHCQVGSEVCCAGTGEAPRCVAQPSDGTYPCSESEVIQRCDESADCASGARCCRTWGCTGGCPEEWACEETACQWGMNEVCPHGAACSDGFRCEASGEVPATCQLAPRPAPQCGAKRCASGELCCFDAETKQGECAASCPEDGVSFACTSPAQCAGHPCGAWKVFGDPSPGVAIHCASLAQLQGSYGRVVCTTVSDCPPRMGMEPTGCKQSDDGMPGVRECSYGE